MLKRVIAFALSVTLIFSCAVVVFAGGDDLEILPNSYDIGDVDMDCNISILDVTEIQRYLCGLITLSDEQLVLSNTNFDDGVSIMDATCIQLYLVGLYEIEQPTESATEDDSPIELPFLPA